LSQEEIQSYYKSYRDENYFLGRNASESFYTRRVHNELERQMGSEERRVALANYLNQKGVSVFQGSEDKSILDFAGGTGRLISDLPGNKYVFDVSGESPALGVSSITQDMLSATRFDLVVCAQMIEHATDPRSQVEDLYSLVKPGGYLYIEVPYNETWRDYSFPGLLRDALLSLAKRFEWFNILWDIYGTAFRVKFKVLPPLAFVPVREHLNYFTPKALVALGESVGGQVVDAARIENLGTTLLIRKAG
jgi:SAM-dependent methyltransferase